MIRKLLLPLTSMALGIAVICADVSAAPTSRPLQAQQSGARVTRYLFEVDRTYAVALRPGHWTQLEFNGDEKIVDVALSQGWETRNTADGGLQVRSAATGNNSALISTSRRRYALTLASLEAGPYDMRVLWDYASETPSTLAPRPILASTSSVFTPAQAAETPSADWSRAPGRAAAKEMRDVGQQATDVKFAQQRATVEEALAGSGPSDVVPVEASHAQPVVATVVTPVVEPVAPTPPVVEFLIQEGDQTLRETLTRWAQDAGWVFKPQHWAVPRDISISASASFGSDFIEAVRGLLEATELGDTPAQPCFYENKVLRVVPIAQQCQPNAGV